MLQVLRENDAKLSLTPILINGATPMWLNKGQLLIYLLITLIFKEGEWHKTHRLWGFEKYTKKDSKYPSNVSGQKKI